MQKRLTRPAGIKDQVFKGVSHFCDDTVYMPNRRTLSRIIFPVFNLHPHKDPLQAKKPDNFHNLQRQRRLR